MKIKAFINKVWAPIAWIVLWQAAAMIISNRLILVSPCGVISRFFELVREKAFWISIFNTGERIIAGYVSGLAVGTLLAAAASKFTVFRSFLSPFISTVKAIPVASFTILALFLIPSKNLSVLVTFLISLPSVYSNIITGIDNTDKKLLEMADLFGIKGYRKVIYIYFSQILPYFKSAATVSAGLSWKSGVAAELIVISTASIGEMLYQAKVGLESADLFAWTMTVILLSYMTEFIFIKIIDGLWHAVERI